MKFQLAVNLERMDDSTDMNDVARHTLEMVQMAEQGGFNIVWAAEHHALEMTIAPNPFQILTWWAGETRHYPAGHCGGNGGLLASDQSRRRGGFSGSDLGWPAGVWYWIWGVST